MPSASATGGSELGQFVLANHIILESVIDALLEFADIVALSRVSRQINLHVRHLFPLQARKLSFAETPAASDENVIGVFEQYLQNGMGSRARKTLLDNGAVVVVGGGVPGTPYTGSWRFLTDLDLSGTAITTTTVKVFFAATCGRKVPNLPAGRFFAREFQSLLDDGIDVDSLLNHQGLRLNRLSVTGCRRVEAAKLIHFFRRVVDITTAKARIRRSTPGGPPNFITAMAQHVPEYLQMLGLTDEDVTSIKGPLPRNADELEKFNLPCSSLSRLDVAGISGLEVAGEDYVNTVFSNIAHLCTVTGVLGIEIDIQFCQGATCAYGVQEDPDGLSFPSSPVENYRDSYKRPMPHIPYERIVLAPSGHIFRFPKHLVPRVNPTMPSGPLLLGPHPHLLPASPNHTIFLQQSQPQVPGPPPGLPVGTNLVMVPILPPHNAHPPSILFQPQVPDMRHTPTFENGRLHKRNVAMLHGPRGLCESCGREVWLCEDCNTFWVPLCGGCAAKASRSSGADADADAGTDNNQ
ncbi:hypothetical protein FN846DRAFT_643893 [Sphaerosporella brunnea]|uniref:Uncharacterized protein n=1 Tax=Sphaerosporella brunnea TaxID=1250544 RepID=A0A5J5EZQ6_9PEZI|nr:hypothetical protein FN846DRAFT_643893 [Sphaerosporella brunnea]